MQYAESVHVHWARWLVWPHHDRQCFFNVNCVCRYQHSRQLVVALNRFADARADLPQGWERKLNREGKVKMYTLAVLVKGYSLLYNVVMCLPSCIYTCMYMYMYKCTLCTVPGI